jgi:hypothetical protein
VKNSGMLMPVSIIRTRIGIVNHAVKASTQKTHPVVRQQREGAEETFQSVAFFISLKNNSMRPAKGSSPQAGAILVRISV